MIRVIQKNLFFRKYLLLIVSITLCLFSGGCKKETVTGSDFLYSAPAAYPSETADLDSSSESVVNSSEAVTCPAEPVTIDIMMIGDMLMHTSALNSGIMADGSYNYDHLFKNIISDIEAADIRIVNQETILGGTQLNLSAYPTFNSPHELGISEVNAGFNVILHATNHALDKGEAGLKSCYDFWTNNYPDTAVLGISKKSDSAAGENTNSNIYIYEKDNFKVAILNYTYGTNGITIPDSSLYNVNLLEETKVTSDIRLAKELADMVVVCPHWGTEYTYEASSEQQKWTNLFLELGVNLVIGTHPHVIQPVETLTRQDGHQMVVYYSLGNFVSNQHKMPRMVGGMANVRLVKDIDGTCYIDSYSLTPIITHMLYGSGKITSYKLCDYTDELALQNQIRTKEDCSTFSLKYCKELCRTVLGCEYDIENDILSVKLN